MTSNKKKMFVAYPEDASLKMLNKRAKYMQELKDKLDSCHNSIIEKVKPITHISVPIDLIKELIHLKKYHIMPYNLGDQRRIGNIIDIFEKDLDNYIKENS